MPTDVPLMTREELAKYLNLKNVQALDNLLWSGRGPPRVKFGRFCRFRKPEVDAWLEAATAAAE